MFGYLVAEPSLLTEEQFARYRACYCGLCRCIKERHGEAARFALTYDMTFLTLLLSSLYEPEETAGGGSASRTRSSRAPGGGTSSPPTPRI